MYCTVGNMCRYVLASFVQASPLATQDLLQAVWTRLHFPKAQQIDMAIKYSSQLFVTQLNQVSYMYSVSPDLSIRQKGSAWGPKFNAKLEL